MSKRNRRKTLEQKQTILAHNEFSLDESKIYLIATIIMFHIIPLIFALLSKTVNKDIMLVYTSFYMSANSLFIGITSIIYGLRKGMNIKFPFILAVLAVLSLVFYAEFTPETAISYRIAFGITYLVIAYLFTALGAFLRKLFRLG